MKALNKIQLCVFILLLSMVSLELFGQKNRELEALADQYKKEHNLSKASSIYLKLIEQDSNNNELILKYANCQLSLLNYKSAYKYYHRIVRSKNNIPPKAYFYYAKSSQFLGKYKEAISGYNKYIKYGLSDYLRSQSEQLIQSCKFAISSKNDTAEYEITHLPSPINTGYSEFNPVAITENELVFSRYESLFDDSTQDVFYQTNVSDIFISKQTQQGWQKPEIFSDKLSSNKFFTGNICFSKNLRTAYFTRCINEDGQIGNCKIYRSIYKSGKWRKPKNIGNKINIPNSSSTQPILAEYDDHDILYFSSNRPNGFGGYDIWYAYIKDNEIQQVSNLGSIINTTGNELCPFYDTDDGILYFSSDTHKGFGGYDIFKSIGGMNKWSSVINIGIPLNSPANDLYYSHRNNGETVYLSSNRIGSYHHNGIENCCGDIYIANRIENNIADKPSSQIQIDSLKEDSTTLAIKNLLPLSLYFENDIPDPKSLNTRTKSNYKDLLKDYVKAKELYKTEYSKGLEGEKEEEAKAQIDSFFCKNVESGFSDLQNFVDLLKSELDAGKNVRIKIRGYASPLNTREYNLALSKRRISSLINYITEYQNGYFKKYINNKNRKGGSLSIYEDPLGDSQSVGIVSDNPNDKRNSIYSRDAALQRKIQIIMYSSDDKDLHTEDYPILALREKEININDLKKGENKSIIVHFKNKGKSELQFSMLTADCKCMQLQMEKANYQSNEEGKFYILLRTKNLKKGNYSQNIIIKSNTLEPKSFIKINFTIK